MLEENGFGDIEIHLNEWNDHHEWGDRGTSLASAGAVSMMCGLHKTKMSLMCYYDARMGVSMYGGLFDPNTRKPVSTYYSIKAFGELYTLGNCVESYADGVYNLAAISSDGTKKAVLLSNIDDAATLKTNLSGMKAYLIEKDVFLKEVEVDLNALKIGKNQVLLLKNY